MMRIRRAATRLQAQLTLIKVWCRAFAIVIDPRRPSSHRTIAALILADQHELLAQMFPETLP